MKSRLNLILFQSVYQCMGCSKDDRNLFEDERKKRRNEEKNMIKHKLYAYTFKIKEKKWEKNKKYYM